MVDRSSQSVFTAMSAFREQAQELRQIALTLKDGDGGGTSGDMEARVAKLEAHMEHVLEDVKAIKSDVGVLKTDVAAIKVKLDALPTKEWIREWMGTSVRNSIAVATGTAAIITFVVTMAAKLIK